MRNVKKLFVAAVLCLVAVSLISPITTAKAAAPPPTGGDEVNAAVGDNGSGKAVKPFKLEEALARLTANNEKSRDIILSDGITPAFVTVTNSEGPVILYVTAYLQWDTTDSHYATNAAANVDSLYDSNIIANPIKDGVLRIPYIAQYSGSITSAWVWLSVHVVAKSSDYQFLPAYLTFIGSSTDNSLNKTNSFADPTYHYGPTSRGLRWHSSDHRASPELLIGYWNNPTNTENEFMSPGAASKYFVYNSTTYTYSQLTNYIGGFHDDFAVTLKWVFYDGSNNPVSCAITLHSKHAVSDLVMKVEQADTNKVVLGLQGDSGTGCILESTPKMHKGTNEVWTDEASMIPGDTYLRNTAPGQYYYRVRRQ